MSRRNRGAGTTFVNNVRGPTSALTSFLNERGIRRANPAPRPPTPPPEEASTPAAQDGEEAVQTARPTSRAARLSRGRAAALAAAATTTASTPGVTEQVDKDGSDSDSDSDSSSDDGLIPIAVSTRAARAAAMAAARSRTRSAAASSNASPSSSAAAAGSSSSPPVSKAKTAAKAKAAAAAEFASRKRARKAKGGSDDSDDGNSDGTNGEFQDITGLVSRSRFSHKERMPIRGNKIVFCSRCRARFTVKAGTVDEGSEMLCPTCAGETANGGVKQPIKATPLRSATKRAKRRAQKLEVECQIPSLQDLCIRKIANCIEDVEAFGDIGAVSMDKICKIISRNRSLNSDTLQLFLDPRQTDLTLYDCTDVTADGLLSIAKFCPELQTLRLALCGRINDSVISYYSLHLTQLTSLSLMGPIVVTEGAYADLFRAIGPRFERFELKNASRFSDMAARVLCESCPNLQRLQFSDCMLMNDNWLDSIGNLTKLKSLTFSDPEADKVTTEPMVKLLQTIGSGLVELSFKGCLDLEDAVLTEAIRPSCVRLDQLSIHGCEGFTTEGIRDLFQDWKLNRGMTQVNMESCVMLKDEALQALLEHSGSSLEELNIKGLDELSKETLMKFAECENLTVLDVSWCRGVDDEVVEKYLNGTNKLEKLVVWGNNRITECCPTRKGLKMVGRETDYIGQRFT